MLNSTGKVLFSLSVVVLSSVAQAQTNLHDSVQNRRAGMHRLVVDGGLIYGVGKIVVAPDHPAAKDVVNSCRCRYSLMEIPIANTNQSSPKKTPFLDAKWYPHWNIQNGLLRWIRKDGMGGQYQWTLNQFHTQQNKKAKKPYLYIEEQKGILFPVESTIQEVKLREKGEEVYYDLVYGKRGLEIWVHAVSSLVIWRYDPSKHELNAKIMTEKTVPYWHKIDEYKFTGQSRFLGIPAKEPLVLTENGKIYKLADNKASYVSKVGLKSLGPSKEPITESNETELKTTCLVLLDTRKDDKSALFIWSGGKLKKLDVVDSKQHRLESFLSAGDVGKGLEKAVEALISAMTRDELKIAECGKRLRASIEKRAKQPGEKTLQQRLER